MLPAGLALVLGASQLARGTLLTGVGMWVSVGGGTLAVVLGAGALWWTRRLQRAAVDLPHAPN